MVEEPHPVDAAVGRATPSQVTFYDESQASPSEKPSDADFQRLLLPPTQPEPYGLR